MYFQNFEHSSINTVLLNLCISSALTPPASRPPLLPRRTFSTHPNVFFAPGFLAQSHLSACKKTPGSNLHADLPYGAETIMTSGSGGDSDSGLYDSATSGSAHTVNIPPANTKVKRATSLDVSKGKVIQRSDSLLQAVLSQIGKKKKQATEPISQSDLIDRLKKVVTFATDITMFSGNCGSFYLFLMHVKT
ncbi:hypothetical protein DPMN_027761 [Dreissena polymorpha]|uniref:Uncharacterized protein n=1 Tax=Dreissena polymorpha TaxID=45954 RepID=A0A9D4RFT9_DREPO|nr:hypothetical protein DPMN_027761 [Dreissena polymorpha]